MTLGIAELKNKQTQQKGKNQNHSLAVHNTLATLKV